MVLSCLNKILKFPRLSCSDEFIKLVVLSCLNKILKFLRSMCSNKVYKIVGVELFE